MHKNKQHKKKDNSKKKKEKRNKSRYKLDTTYILPFRHKTNISNALKRGKENKNMHMIYNL